MAKNKFKWVTDKMGTYKLDGTGYELQKAVKSFGVVYRIYKNGEYLGLGTGLNDAKQLVKENIEEGVWTW